MPSFSPLLDNLCLCDTEPAIIPIGQILLLRLLHVLGDLHAEPTTGIGPKRQKRGSEQWGKVKDGQGLAR